MSRPRKLEEPLLKSRRSPARTPEERERQLTALAYDLAERRMRDGTASSAEVTHFLRIASEKDRLERDILREQRKLVKAKTDAIESAKEQERLYQEVMEAMKSYSTLAKE